MLSYIGVVAVTSIFAHKSAPLKYFYDGFDPFYDERALTAIPF